MNWGVACWEKWKEKVVGNGEEPASNSVAFLGLEGDGGGDAKRDGDRGGDGGNNRGSDGGDGSTRGGQGLASVNGHADRGSNARKGE